MKKTNIILTSVTALAIAMPAMADNVQPNIAANAESADCDNETLGTTSGTSNLQAEWTPNTLNIDWYNGDTKLTSNTCTYDSGITVPSNNPTKTGYTFDGWKVKTSAFDLNTLNTSLGGISFASKNFSVDHCVYYNTTTNDGIDSNTCNESVFGDLDAGEWSVNFSYGTVYGEASCQATIGADLQYITDWSNFEKGPETMIAEYSALAGAERGALLRQVFSLAEEGKENEAMILLQKLKTTDSQYTTNSRGRYCFCKATGYTPLNGNKQNVLPSPWGSPGDLNDADGCERWCAYTCAATVISNEDDGFRISIFGSAQ